jgi:hypothetical protein
MDHIEFLCELLAGRISWNAPIPPLKVSSVDPHHHRQRVAYIEGRGIDTEVQTVF